MRNASKRQSGRSRRARRLKACPRPLALAAALALAACSRSTTAPSSTSGSPSSAPSTSTASPLASQSDGSAATGATATREAGARPPVGSARMLADGTIEIDMFNPHARLVYPPTHAKYKDVLQHIGGMKPGETRLVPPWPDPWDAQKVDRAARAHAAKKGWQPGEYDVELTGTDGDGNAVVTLVHKDDKHAKNPGGGRSVQLRISRETYEVVRELAFQ